MAEPTLTIQDYPLRDTANSGDWLLMQDADGVIYRISKADFLTGSSTSSDSNNNSSIVNSGLIVNLDAGDINSYPGTGTSWSDLAGNNHCTLVNTSYLGADGGSIVFNGNGYGIMATPSTIVTDGSISIELWVKWTTTGESTNNIQLLIDNNHTDNQGFVIQDLPHLSSKAIGALGVSSTGVVGTGNWVNIIATLTNQASKLYINGTLNNSTARNSGLLPVQPNITIGKWQGGTRYLVGNIAIVRIYHKELTAAEVTQNFGAIKARFGL